MNFLATITRAAILGRIVGVTIREWREQQAQRGQPCYRGSAPPIIAPPMICRPNSKTNSNRLRL